MKRLFSVLSLCSLILLIPACGYRGRGRCCPQPCAPVYAAPCATPCATAPYGAAYGPGCADGSCAAPQGGYYADGAARPADVAAQPEAGRPVAAAATADMAADEDLGADVDLDEDLDAKPAAGQK